MPVQSLHAPGRARVAHFVDKVFAHLPRADQRYWAGVYLQGLLATPGRKTLRNLAASAPESRTAALSLQQFINDSPWDWRPSRRAVARHIAEVFHVRTWVATSVVIPKRGDHAVGTENRFVAELGRTLKCQVAYGLFATNGSRAFPVDWALHLDPGWTEDPQRRRRARIPAAVGPRTAAESLLAMADRTGRDAGRPPLVADVAFAGDAVATAGALARRGFRYVLEVTPQQLLRPVAAPVRAVGAVPGPVPARRLFPAGAGAVRRGERFSRRVLVRLPGPEGDRQQEAVHRLWLSEGHRRRYWLTNLGADEPEPVVRLVSQIARSHATLGHLGAHLGLRDFSGRSFIGWHHHMTMLCAAYALHETERLPRRRNREIRTGGGVLCHR
jgi:hypothetical protein